jgi:hypothetical protein
MVERFHRQLKNALRARSNGDWLAALPWVLLGLRAAPKDDSNRSSAEMVYGSPLVLPGELLESPEPAGHNFFEKLSAEMCKFQPPITPVFNTKVHVPEVLRKTAFVYVRRDGHVPSLSPLYEGPFLVLSKRARTYTIMKGSREEVVSIDRLKPHLGSEPEVQFPACRGRPPGRLEPSPDGQ